MGRYQRDIHTLLNYLYSHIVYSIFCCMFEVLQRCSQPNTTIMKITSKQIESAKKVLSRMDLNTWTRLVVDNEISNVVINTSSSQVKFYNCPNPINPTELIGNEIQSLYYNEL